MIATPLKMKDLISRTGVSKQTIHFYLREGLLPEPERPKHNVAHYSEEHVVRIQAIKSLQRDRSLQLGEIRELLESFDYSTLSQDDYFFNFELALLSRLDGDLPSQDQPLKEVSKKTGLSRKHILELNQAGAIQIKRQGKKELLNFRDAGILESWAKLIALGLGDDPAFQTTFIARYAAAIKPIAEYVIDSFFEHFHGHMTEEVAEVAALSTAATNELLVRMHTQALLRAMKERINQE